MSRRRMYSPRVHPCISSWRPSATPCKAFFSSSSHPSPPIAPSPPASSIAASPSPSMSLAAASSAGEVIVCIIVLVEPHPREQAVEAEPEAVRALGVAALDGVQQVGPRAHLRAAPARGELRARLQVYRQAHVLRSRLLPHLCAGEEQLEAGERRFERGEERQPQHAVADLRQLAQNRVLRPLVQQLPQPVARRAHRRLQKGHLPRVPPRR
eukprot:2898499-Pyramimonas_sp.AAC.2